MLIRSFDFRMTDTVHVSNSKTFPHVLYFAYIVFFIFIESTVHFWVLLNNSRIIFKCLDSFTGQDDLQMQLHHCITISKH